MSQEFTRRRFLATVAVAVPAGAALMSAATATAADLPKLDVNDPTAKQLNYTPNATTVNAKNPATSRYVAGQHCANCQVIQGKDGEAYRPCAIFPGKLVSAAGWCSAWAKKA